MQKGRLSAKPPVGTGVSVKLSPLQDAWLTAIADVRGATRSDVVREALSWLAARETDRIARTRHYRVIGLIARQEAWNPVDDYLRTVREVDDDDYVVGARLPQGVLRAALRAPRGSV
jgi:Arc/MetJ-type ribon-helix-helix transcriptional regulator